MRRYFAAASVAALLAVVPAGSALAQEDTTAPTLDVATFAAPGPVQYGSGTAGQTPLFGTGIGQWYVNTGSGAFEGVRLNLTASDNVAVTALQYSVDNGATWIDAAITSGPAVSGVATITREGNTPAVRYRASDAAGNTSAERTIAVPIDTVPPVVTYPTGANGVNNNRIGHSAYVTPNRTDPAPSSGTPATREAEIDGAAVTTQPLDASKLSLGRHTWSVTANDVAGNSTKSTLTFLVTTSYADVDALLTRYTTPASTTLGAAAAAGATSIRLASNRGRVAGDTLTLGSETATIRYIPVPNPTGTTPNVVLTAPLAGAHANGAAVAITPATPPAVSADLAASLRAKLNAARSADEAGDKPAAIAQLEAFAAEAGAISNAKIRDLLAEDAKDLIRQARGLPEPWSTAGLGVSTAPGNRTNQHRLMLPSASTLEGTKMLLSAAKAGYNPNARFKVLVMSNRSDGFRHESIQTYERMIQQLGIDNDFDVDLFDYVYPNESIPNPFYIKDGVNNLSKYAVIAGVSSVGNNQFTVNRVFNGADAEAAGVPAGTVFNEQEAFQNYIANGGGFVGLHGASDSMHNWAWYTDFIAGEFQNHGNNTGAQQPQCPSCNITEVVTEDPSHPSTKHMPDRFLHRDELYNFRSPPREKAHPLMTLTDASFSTGFNDGVAPGFTDSQATINGSAGTNTFNAIPGYGEDHPISWCAHVGFTRYDGSASPGGRMWADILTHNWEPAYDPRFQLHILKGIEWAGGQISGNCVTHREVKTRIARELSGEAAASATALVDAAYLKYLEKRYGAAVADIDALKAAVPSDGLKAKAQELKDWMHVLNGAAIVDGPGGPGGGVGGTVPATLSLSLGAPASFGAFTPGVTRDYFASTTATVISTAGDALLSVADPSSTATGRLVNGSFALPQALQANANGAAHAAVGGSSNPTPLLTYTGPVSNDSVTLGFQQSIGATDALRTGAYSKTLTYTLSTTTP